MTAEPAIWTTPTMGAIDLMPVPKKAVLANYRAGLPSRTTSLNNWIGTNPNSIQTQIQRVNMMFSGEVMIKDCPFAVAYSELRKMYCTPLRWIPDTGDDALNGELSDYLHHQWEDAGNNCSLFDALARTFDVEMPARGDAGLILFRDVEAGRLRYLEFSADQLGELWSFNVPFGDPIDGTTYFAGIYSRASNGQTVAYKIYERGYNQIYCNPQIYAACDVIFVKTGPFRGIRGITDFHAAILSVEKGDRFLQNALDAATKQASREGFIKNERGQPDEGSYETDTNLDGTVTYFNRALDGTVTEYLFKGDEYQAAEVTMPGPEVLEGYDKALEQGALALGFPFSFLVNATKVGGAPSRLEIEKATKKIDSLIRYRTPFLNRIARTEILDAIARGKFPARAEMLRGHWQFPKSPTADAFHDSKSQIDEIRYGIQSPQRACAQDNNVFKDVLREKGDAVLAANLETARVNKALAGTGQKVSVSDIMASSENPAQSAQAESLESGVKPAPEKAIAAEWDESKHSRDDDGKFGDGGGHGKAAHEANQASDKAHGDQFSPILHDEAAKKHEEAVKHKEARIESVKSSGHLKEAEKKKLISGYKKDIKHHEFMRTAHERAAKETDEIQRHAEKSD